MAPEIPHSYSNVTPITPLLSRISPKSHFKPILHHKCCRPGGRMTLTKRKLIPLLVFVLCSASVFRFLNISMVSNLSAQLPPPLPPMHSTMSSTCKNNISHPNSPSQGMLIAKNETNLTEKEARFLLEFISTRIPCNLLIFGDEREYTHIAYLNGGGATVILDDNHRMSADTNNATRVFRIMYNTVASEAYQLLKVARENPNCSPKVYLGKARKCNLALRNLPKEVYNTVWDVVVVDGPRGDSPDSPGRMTSIYTASMLARRGNTTHVIVHDVDRMIEKWFSWEFLCEENLVSSKERFQLFLLQGGKTATKFCTS